MQEKICCVTYGELDQLVRQVVDEYEDSGCCFDIVEGIREENLDKINRSILEGAEIIIAGGANAQVVRGYFKVPVIDYKVTFIDYMQALQTGFEEGKTVALVCYRTQAKPRLKQYLEQIKMPVLEIIYEDTEELKEKIRNSGAEVFVGNALAVDLAKNLGRKGVLLYCGKDSIKETIEEARRLMAEIRKDKERNQFVKAMMNYSPNGVIYLDTGDRITDCNRSLYDMLNRKPGTLEGKIIHDVLPECVPDNRGDVESRIVRLGDNKYIERWITVEDGNGYCFGSIIILALFSDYKKAELDYRKRRYEQRKERGFTAKFTLKDIKGNSYAMKMVRDEAELYAQSDAAVLICGETGVGKELFAQGIHSSGMRKNGPFVAINCAALPETLLESELFGYDEGAFTGGRKGGKRGLFELADGGSIFLDEIGEIPPSLQARLLRVLQEKEIMHVGGDRMIPVDVRVITATNKRLEQMEEREFRRDLLYRLNVLELHIPALKSREDDVIELFEFYFNKKKKMETVSVTLTDDMKEMLKRYSWRGNIRELQNVCERFCLYMERNTRFNEQYAKRCIIKAIGEDKLLQDILAEYTDKDNKELIKEIKRLFSYNNDQVGQALGVSRTTLWRILNDK